MKKYSIIVPTMWRYLPFLDFLIDLTASKVVGEIIIIDNDVLKRPGIFEYNSLYTILNHDKIKILPQQSNIGVNPAWNLGVDLSINDFLCILNDDIRFDLSILPHILHFLTEHIGVIGLCAGNKNFFQPEITDKSIEIIPWRGQNTLGFGSLMFINKKSWIPIPKELLIYYGDSWIFDTCLFRNKQNFLITNMDFFTPWAQTTRDKLLTEGLLDKESIIFLLEYLKFTKKM